MLYPLYAAEWHLAPVVTTSVFGTYPLALLITLLLLGGISDAIGRRRAMLLGVDGIALASVLFAIAPNVGFLFAGRVLQGVGTGLALSAASASLVEHTVFRNPRIASSLTTASTSTGLTLSLVVSGVLAQYLPLPLVLSFVVLFVLGVLSFVLVWLTPDDAPRDARFVVRAPRLASGIAVPFAIATLSVAIAYAVGAMFLSLGASMARAFTGTADLAVTGALLAISTTVIMAVSLLIARVHALVSIAIGAVVSLAGLVVMALAASDGSLALFVVWCLVGGAGYSFAFTGGLALVNRAAPAHHRGATLSLVYLFSYLAQAATAIGAGALATALGLAGAVDLMAPIIAVLCAAALVLIAADAVRARRRILTA